MMNINYYEWYSHRVGRNMGVLRYGHWGPPMIYFPTCGGSHGEFDYYRLQDDLWWFIENGKIQIFCVDSTNNSTWYNPWLHPADRVRGYLAYESYMLEEVIPLVRNLSRNDHIGCTGFSLGGFTSFNMACKYPHIFKFAMSCGGVFDTSDFLEGYHDMNVYFNNPVEYLSNMNDNYYLDMYRNNTRLILMGGGHDKFVDSTYQMHDILSRRGIPHHYEIWPGPCDHHEYWWKKQFPYILGKYYV
ncbi:MAG: alpha/beta hydrolase-fold protein [Vulcanimicrobiota bacterium]